MAIRPPVALIAGPTASGKSALALALAEACAGVIINADSAQIYSDLPILSASPTPEDRERADHRLYGVREGARSCSAAEWAKLARREVSEAHAAGRLPILVGGTGLYLRTLLDGIAPVPPIDPVERTRIRARSVSDNRTELALRDPEAAERLSPNDGARIARSLEVIVSTGKPLREWQQRRSGGLGDSVDLRPLVLLPPRDWLYERCDERFAAMFRDGGIEEVESLLAQSLDPDLPVMRAIGVREIARYICGDISHEDALASGQQATRNYAKRQYTWFSHQPPAHWTRFGDPLDNNRIGDALALLGPTA